MVQLSCIQSVKHHARWTGIYRLWTGEIQNVPIPTQTSRHDQTWTIEQLASVLSCHIIGNDAFLNNGHVKLAIMLLAYQWSCRIAIWRREVDNKSGITLCGDDDHMDEASCSNWWNLRCLHNLQCKAFMQRIQGKPAWIFVIITGPPLQRSNTSVLSTPESSHRPNTPTTTNDNNACIHPQMIMTIHPSPYPIRHPRKSAL